MFMSPRCLLFTLKFFCFLYMSTTQRGLINMQGKEWFIGRHFGIRCITDLNMATRSQICILNNEKQQLCMLCTISFSFMYSSQPFPSYQRREISDLFWNWMDDVGKFLVFSFCCPNLWYQFNSRIVKRFSNDCRKTKTNHNRNKQHY